MRQEAFGQDIGQNGWLTVDEQDLFIEWLELSDSSQLLDIACGSGRPTLRIAAETGCSVTGVDLNEDAVKSARQFAEKQGLAERATFEVGDAAEELHFDANRFDAVTCIDSINHLPDRLAVLKEWYRVLKPGGRLLFTDPIVVTGALTNEEIAIRASIGFFLFVPADEDQRLLEIAGFKVERVMNSTKNVARNARGWLEAREQREGHLRKIEGDEAFDGQQEFFDTAARLAEEQRLSRIAIFARKSV